jgi:hypothetical protein
MYFVTATISSNNMDIEVFKRGSASNVDFTTILDAGDNFNIIIHFSTAW